MFKLFFGYCSAIFCCLTCFSSPKLSSAVVVFEFEEVTTCYSAVFVAPESAEQCFRLLQVVQCVLRFSLRNRKNWFRLLYVVQFVSFVAIVQVVRFVSGCFTWFFVVQVVYIFCEFQTGFNLFAFCRSLF